jgi:hypothetical protein
MLGDNGIANEYHVIRHVMKASSVHGGPRSSN